MTIEIKQLVIRAIVDGRHAQAPHSDAPRAVPVSGPVRPEPLRLAPAEDREALIAACVREVLRTLDRARQR